jgi:hypothetical protein
MVGCSKHPHGKLGPISSNVKNAVQPIYYRINLSSHTKNLYMSNLDKLHEMYPELDLFKADGFDDAIIGLEPLSGKVIYDIDLMVSVLMEEGLDNVEAIEYLDYNVLNAYVGEQTPIYIQTVNDD